MAEITRDKIRCFAEMFQFDQTRQLRSLTKSDLMESCLFLDSTPNEFSLNVLVKGNENYETLFQNLYNFIKSEANQKKEISQELECSLYPIFCNIYMILKKDNKEDLMNAFVEVNLPKIPEKDQYNASKFVMDDNFFSEQASFFETQKYIVHCSLRTAKVFNEFLNRPENSQLKGLVTSFIILQNNQPPVPHPHCVLKFQNPNELSNLNILVANVKNTTLAHCSAEAPNLFFVRDDRDVYKLDIFQQQIQKIYVHPSIITTISASSSSRVAFSCDICGNALLWSKDGTVDLPQITNPAWCSQFSPSGGIFAFGSNDSTVKLFDTPKQKPIRYFVGHQGNITDVKFHHNCSLIASCASDSTVRLWDVREAKTIRLWITHPKRVNILAFSWDGKMIAFIDSDLVIGELATSKEIMRRKIQSYQSIISLHFSNDNRFVYALFDNGKIVAYELLLSTNPNNYANESNNNTQLILDLKPRIIASDLDIANNMFVITSQDY